MPRSAMPAGVHHDQTATRKVTARVLPGSGFHVIPRQSVRHGRRAMRAGTAASSGSARVNSRELADCRPGRAALVLWIVCLLLTGGFMHAGQAGEIEAGNFSASGTGDSLPQGWRPLTFSRIPRHTDYFLVEDAGTVVVKAVSDQSASGLARALSISPREYPVVEWRWKVNNVLQKGDAASRKGDDYPARLYITFAFDSGRAGYLERLQYQAARLLRGDELPYRAIAYIWGSNSPAGSMLPNAYTDRVMMFVVENGSGKLRQWVTERRNVYADYKQAFGTEPPMISGVAIMTDTDNTRESAIAWYGDIVFRDRP